MCGHVFHLDCIQRWYATIPYQLTGIHVHGSRSDASTMLWSQLALDAGWTPACSACAAGLVNQTCCYPALASRSCKLSLAVQAEDKVSMPSLQQRVGVLKDREDPSNWEHGDLVSTAEGWFVLGLQKGQRDHSCGQQVGGV